MLSITNHEIVFEDGYLDLTLDLEYEVEVKERTGLEYYATVTGEDGSLFATPVETILLSSDENEVSIHSGFTCPASFSGKRVTVYYRAFFEEQGGVVDLGSTKKGEAQIITNFEDGKWEAGSISTVAIKAESDAADLTITLCCSDPREWAWLVTPLSGDARSYEHFEPFGVANTVTCETNTYELQNGIQLDVTFLRAGPSCTVSVEI